MWHAMLTPEQIQIHKNHIDGLSQYDMAHMWRFSKAGENIYFTTPELTEHFNKRFKELGGMTPELSKELGW